MELWGRPVGLPALVRSCGDLILAGEPVKYCFTAYGEPGSWPGRRLVGISLGLSQGKLRQCLVRPRGIEMVQLDREDPASVAFVHDQDPVEQLVAQGSDHAFADRIRSWRSRWTGKNPDDAVA
jgi:hypothetical protein